MGHILLGSAQPLTDWHGQAQDFLDQYLPLKWVTPPRHAYVHTYGQEHPPSNYTPYQSLKPNQAYWPTGATRWGYGYLLMTGVEKAKLPPNAKVSLEVSTPRHTLTTTVFPQPARQILHAGGAANGGLWIVPFVDTRYWWQFQKGFIDWTAAQPMGWSDVIDQIAAALQVTITYPTIESEMLYPDQSVLKRYSTNAAVLLDVIAGSLGYRVVRNWNDNYELQGPTEAKAGYDANALITPDHCLTGLNYSVGNRPAQIDLIFRAGTDGMVNSNWQEYRSSYITTGANRVTTPLTEMEIKASAVANYDSQTIGDPTNKTELDALASTLGNRLEAWRDRVYDHSYSGVQNWTLCGFDDFVIHQFGVESMDYEVDHPDANESAKIQKVWRPISNTRIASYPDNYIWTRNYSVQEGVYTVPRTGEALVRMTKDLLPGDTEAQAVLTTPGDNNPDGTVYITDYDYNYPPGRDDYGATCALVGELIWVQINDELDQGSARPVSTHSHGLIRLVKLSQDIPPQGTGNASIVRQDAQAGPTIPVTNSSSITMKGGEIYGALWIQTADNPGWYAFGGVGGEGDPVPGIIEFTLGGNGLSLTDTFASATRTKVWNGADPGAAITVWNSAQQFQGPPGTAGVAVQNLTDSRWQIIVLWDRQARFIEFSSSLPVTQQDNSFQATLDAYYDGVFPGSPLTIWNTKNIFWHPTQLAGLARYDFYRGRYQVVYAPAPADANQWAIVNTRETFTTETPTVSCDIDTVWNGSEPPGPIDVINTCKIFFGNEQPLCGIAARSANNGNWYMVQLKCVAPASQAVYSQASLPDYDDTPTPVPFDVFEHSAGDMVSLNASGEVVFDRNARGAVRVDLGATWTDQLGPSAAETSALTFQHDPGTGWQDVGEAALALTHVYQRIPPNNYIMGGSTSRSYWSQIIFQAGDKLRVMAQSRGGEIITSLTDCGLELLETYDPPV